MCNHNFIKINDIKVCIKCGLTRLYNGKIFFDKKIKNFRKEQKNDKRI